MEGWRSDLTDEQIISSFPGWRFVPNDEEIINFLKNKRLDPAGFSVCGIRDVDIYHHDPDQLPALSALKSEKLPMYFFTTLDCSKYKNSTRVNRITDAGYWKVTAQDLPIKSQEEVIGIRKILNFHKRDKNGKDVVDTHYHWIMHEYNSMDNLLYKEPVLCRIERKTKPKKQPEPNNKRNRDEGESHYDLISESRSEDVQSTLSEVEPHSVLSHCLVSNAKNQRKRKPNKRRKPNNECCTSTIGDEGNSHHDLLSRSRRQDVQSTVSEVVPPSVSSQHLVSNDRNHVAQNISTQISNDRNHVAQKTSTPILDYRNHVSQNTPTQISDDRNHVAQKNSTPISNDRNHVAQKTSTQISNRNHVAQNTSTLISSNRNHVAQNTSTQISNDGNHVAQNTSAPISDYRNHVAQNASTQISNDRNHVAQNTSTPISSDRNHVSQNTSTLISNDGNHVAQNTSTPMISDYRNHVTSTLISNDGNHVAQNTSTPISDYRNHVAQNTSTQISNDRNHVAQNTSTTIEKQSRLWEELFLGQDLPVDFPNDFSSIQHRECEVGHGYLLDSPITPVALSYDVGSVVDEDMLDGCSNPWITCQGLISSDPLQDQDDAFLDIDYPICGGVSLLQ